MPTEDQPPPRLVSTDKAAEAIGVDRTTLFRWAKQGYVTPAYTSPGRHMRWDVDDLRRQLREREGQ